MTLHKPVRGERYLVPTLLVPSHDHLQAHRVVVEVFFVDEERDVVRYAYRSSGRGPVFERPRLVFLALATLIEDGDGALDRLETALVRHDRRERARFASLASAEASGYVQERREKFHLERSRPGDRPRLVELHVRTTEFHHCFLPMPNGEPLPVSADGFVACPRERGDWVGLVTWSEEVAGYVLHLTNGADVEVKLLVDAIALEGRVVKLRKLLEDATRIAASCHVLPSNEPRTAPPSFPAHPPGGDPFTAFRGARRG